MLSAGPGGGRAGGEGNSAQRFARTLVTHQQSDLALASCRLVGLRFVYVRTFLLAVSVGTALAAVEWRMAIVTSWGAYGIGVSLTVLFCAVGATAALRVIALRGTPVGKFGVWMVIEAVIVVGASVHDFIYRQPDLLPVMLAVLVLTDCLAVGQPTAIRGGWRTVSSARRGAPFLS